MIKAILLSVFMLVSVVNIYGQTQQKIRVKANEDFSEALNSYGIYRFSAFTLSTIIFRSGTTSQARLNYNLALADMQFIGNNNDTLVITNPGEIKYLLIDTVLFYYDDQNYMEVIASNNDVHLSFSQKIQIDFEKLGALGKPAPGLDIKDYKTYVTPIGTAYNLISNEDRVITKTERYYLIDKFGHAATAGKNNFIRSFPDHKAAIQEYLKNNKVDFNNLKDLKTLFQFCTEIKPGEQKTN